MGLKKEYNIVYYHNTKDQRVIVDILDMGWSRYDNGGAHMCYRNMFPQYKFSAGQYSLDEIQKGKWAQWAV